MNQSPFSYWKRDAHLTEILAVWEELETQEKTEGFLLLPLDTRVDLLSELSFSEQEALIRNLSTYHRKTLFHEMEPDDLADFFQSVSPEIRREAWENLDDEAKRETLFLLRFDEDDAAGLMTPRYMALNAASKVSQALNFIRQRADDVETIYYAYVIDALEHLKGVVSLRELLLAPDDLLIRDLMQTDIISVREETDQEDVARILDTNELLAIPVVDQAGKLLGIITFDDVIDVIREEQTEDVYKMGAMSGGTEPYLSSNILTLIKKRIPWLTILLLLGTITTHVLDHYEGLIVGATLLFIFMPVITQTGGNSGSQCSTLMIRGLATEEIRFRDFWCVLRKELLVGLLMGLCLGLIIFIRSLLLPPGIQVTEALVLAFALSFVVMFSTLIGSIAPLIIHKLGFDPAVMSAPLMATVIDVVGLTIYFETAQFLLGL